MNWPPDLSNLNPIENFWKIVKDMLKHNNKLKNKTKNDQTHSNGMVSNISRTISEVHFKYVW